MRCKLIGYAAVVVLFGTSMKLSGDVLVDGPPVGLNCLPIGCPSEADVTEYQQLYAASNFPSAVTINGLTFFYTFLPPGETRGEGLAQGGNFVVALSTVTADVSTFNNLIQAGPDNRVLFSGSLDGFFLPYFSSFTLGGGTFFYDPTKGNLLMDVLISGAPLSSSGGGLDSSASALGIFSRATNGSNTGTVGVGLDTRFDTVPEPPTFGLVAAGGLIALGRLVPIRRQSRK